MTPEDQGVRVGTAPDSWGVWFPDDPKQVPWDRFLDEVVASGYQWIELGPYGYLPTDPGQLAEELGKRDLKLAAGTVFTGLHKGDQEWKRAWDQALAVAGLVSELGATNLVVIPDMWRSAETGEMVEPRTLTNEQWEQLAAGHDRLGKAIQEEFGVTQRFHSHADTHVGTYREVERFLELTDASYTSLCLDTGHFAYYGGDNLELIENYPDRVGYLHLKQVDGDLIHDVLKNDLSFVDAVAQEVMVEPPNGVPALGPIIDAVAAHHPEGVFGIVEQDMYGCALDRPFPIAQRTREHIRASTPNALT